MSKIVAEWVWLLATFAILAIRIPPLLRSRQERVQVAVREPYNLLAALYVIGTVAIPGQYVVTDIPQTANYAFLPALGWIGGAAAVIGVWLFYRAHADLGRQWSSTLEIRQGHRLVTNGIYARLRHPMYTSFIALTLSQALLLPNWIVGPAGLVAYGVFILLRIPPEEQLLLRQFGDDYRVYMARTQRIIPWVW
jgi:protein-S-isoprenylcysteine O-methyltransferase Ste14